MSLEILVLARAYAFPALFARMPGRVLADKGVNVMKWSFIGLFGAAAMVAAADRPDRNSFIDYPVHSAQDLVHQIETDPAVADRFERNFSMTKEQVISMISGLHTDRLAQTAVYNVYSVPPDGHIKWHQQRLKKGLPIFADASGNPVLVEKCGNPLVMVSPTPGGPPVAGPTAPIEPMSTPIEDVPNAEMAMAPPPATPNDVYVPPTVAAIPPAGAGFSGAGGAGTANFGWLGLLGAGGAIYGLSTIHGTSHHPTPPVPEPASICLLAPGVLGLVALKKRQSRSSRR